MKDPLHDQEQFGHLLGLTARLWRAEIDRRLVAFGLTESRWQVLWHLSRQNEATTQRELAEAIGVRGPTLVRTLDRLEAEGLVERRAETGDRRSKSIHLRAGATPVLERIETTLTAVRAEIFSELSHTEVTNCMAVLEKIVSKLHGAETAMQGTHEPSKKGDP